MVRNGRFNTTYAAAGAAEAGCDRDCSPENRNPATEAGQGEGGEGAVSFVAEEGDEEEGEGEEEGEEGGKKGEGEGGGSEEGNSEQNRPG